MMIRFLLPLALALASLENVATSTPADAADALKAIRACVACHTFEKGGTPKIGPNLYGIVDKPAARVSGFDKYGIDMRDAAAKGLAWTPDNIDAYIADPVAFLKAATGKAEVRTNMIARVRKPEERAAIIDYLKTLKD